MKKEVKLITLDPGHFHAALIQKEMYPWVSKRVEVYAPLGPDLNDYLNRIALFNSRKENPTAWDLDVHCSNDFFERMLRERSGNVVVTSGRNLGKIDRIKASVEAGFHVLADKPWIISSADLAKLEAALDSAQQKGLVAYDVMTERYEITSLLQRALVNDPDTFGQLVPGSGDEPGVYAKSVHHLMKLAAGVPIRRPGWFFDIHQQGEGLSDVGTHVVDLVQWTAFPSQPIDYRNEIRVLEARHWPTTISKTNFQRITGETEFPASSSEYLSNGSLEYYCNNSVHYTIRGIHTRLDILWNWEAPQGAGDTYFAAFRGSKARVEIRQGERERYGPELYVVPNSASARSEVVAALRKKIEALQSTYADVGVEMVGEEARIVIPDRYRVGHEAHFAQVTNRFFDYLNAPETMPAWEKANMLAKYFVSTKGVELARSSRK